VLEIMPVIDNIAAKGEAKPSGREVRAFYLAQKKSEQNGRWKRQTELNKIEPRMPVSRKNLSEYNELSAYTVAQWFSFKPFSLNGYPGYLCELKITTN